MGTLIYCKNSIAASPYYIEEASLNVYSLEELSYYMLNNVYLLSNKLMTTELCNWIGREIKEPKLAGELLDLMHNNAPLHIFVGHILSANGYSSKKEIKDLLAIISTFENKSEAECRKLRADRLMNNDKIVDAIYEYEAILSDEVAKQLSRQTEGDVYHNLGTAFARLFFFDEAVRCFDEAYKRNLRRDSLESLLFAARCKKDKPTFDSYVAKYQVPVDIVNETLARVNHITGREAILEFDKAINELTQKDDDNESFFEQAAIQIEKWQADYTKLCRI